ncbi:MAG TPA: DNA polymerase III subunit gamma/tau [bacterium]|nr:DNA polymerase III subunit gamma/tau [bacterium]
MTRTLREVTSVSHVSFYRKWRPQTFDDVIGQERVTRTLQNAITANRIVHAYLFCGHRGTGKTTTARILAKALNCEHGPTPTPCNTCAICEAIGNGVSLDVIEIDAASNRGIDEIRDLREKVKLMPVEGRHKVYIIDEAHMLTSEAANALLKTLEEPPPHAIFVLVTTEPHRLPATITSRTQRFDFRRISQTAIVERLRTMAESEGITAADDAFGLIARSADGALRDAESVLDQLSAFCQGRITKADVLAVLGLIEEEVAHQVTDAVIAGDAAACLEIAHRVIAEGRDVRQILRSLVEHFRDLLVVAVVGDPRAIVETSEDRLETLRVQSARLTPGAILQQIRILTAAEAEVRFATQPRVVLEMALLKLSRPEVDATIEGLAARVEALERQGGSGSAPRPAVERPPAPPKDETPTPGPGAPPARPSTRRSPRGPRSEAAEAAPSPIAAAPAPAVAPSPAGPSEGATTGVDLEVVLARWGRLMDEVKQRTRSVHAFLLESAPRAVEGSDLVLAVRHKFHLENLHEIKNRRLVEELLAVVVGVPLRLRLVLGETEPPPEAAAAESSPPGDALVQEAVRRFGNPVREIRHPE